MALFRKQPIAEAALFEALTHHPSVLEIQATAPIDVAAFFVAIALVESNYDVLAEGDFLDGKPTALGLFQINSRVHVIDASRLADVNYQITIACGILAELLHEVKAALPTIAKRREEVGAVAFEPARDVPHFFNVGWQFGSGALRAWLVGWPDLTIEGFAAFRRQTKPLGAGEVAYRTRAARFRARYDRVVADAPSWWSGAVEDAKAKGGAFLGAVALAGPAGVAVGAVGAGVSAGAKAKEFYEEHKPELPDPFGPFKELLAFLKLIASAAALVVVVLVILALLVVLWELRRAKRFTRETVEPRVRSHLGGAS